MDFPVGEPEVVFKFRHPDLQTAAETDVRPSIPGQHVMKFKAEALPLKERARAASGCSIRTTCEFLTSAAPDSEQHTAMREIVRPCRCCRRCRSPAMSSCSW